MKQTIDNFSCGAADYALYRPQTPDSLFEFLFNKVNHFDTAWDCGTGNGQVAVRLADKFKQVFGTDISEDQLKLAVQKPNITYMIERAEQTSLPDHSIDLVTVGQAIHWFDFEHFYREAHRVAKPGALLAAWTYTVLKLNPEIDAVINRLYEDITHKYWDKERAHVDAGYRTIPFPFERIETPVFYIKKQYTLNELAGYLRTWSGVKHYVAQTQTDPVSLILNDLEKAWGKDEKETVSWPVHMLTGRIR